MMDKEANYMYKCASKSVQRKDLQMKKYKQLSQSKRYQIYALKKAKYTTSAIAKELNVNTSTVFRELKRNTGSRGYRPGQAQCFTDERRCFAKKHIRFTPSIEASVIAGLSKEWSPDQIANRLIDQGKDSVSHETIYKFIWANKKAGGDLYKSLRHGQKQRKKRSGVYDKRGQIKDRVSIDDRPAIVEDKKRIGDWEIDTVVGKNHKGFLVTIVERRTSFTLIKYVHTKSAEVVAKATIELLMPYKNKTHTITADNGKEFSMHKEIKAAVEASVYFAHPYSSWERGLNENTNGLIRQYFKKGTSFEDITDDMVNQVMFKLNNRPRKKLCYKTPSEIFFRKRRICG